MLYIFITLFLLFLLYRVKGTKIYNLKDRREYLLLSSLLILSLYIFKDNKLFPDLDDYFYLYEAVQSVPLNKLLSEGISIQGTHYDTGYLVYNKILSFISSDYLFLIFVNALIIMIGYLVFIKRYSDYLFMALALFILGPFYHTLFIYRQFIAIAICLMSIPYIIQNKPIKFLILLALAFSFHKTAIIFAVLYPLFHLKLGKWYWLLWGIIGFVALTYRLMFIEYAIQYVGVADVYTMANESNGGETSYTFFIINLLIMVFVVIFGNIKSMEGVEKLMFDSLFLVVVIDLAAVGMDGTIAGRLAAYFTPCNLILLPNICKRMNLPNMIKPVVVFVILFCFYLTFKNGFTYGFSF